ncbi:MAG TPA: aminotransferase class V-fold PLP-dependent enzyme [Kofleriaceae bacterium]|jgi:cysteine desulfurase
MQPIYLDHAASTRVTDDVLALMTDVMRTAWGNPSGQHPQGAAARGHIATARGRVLAALGDADGAIGDLVWTSGCSESDALALLGIARRRAGKIVISAVEHAAVGALAMRLASPSPEVVAATGERARDVMAIAPTKDGLIEPSTAAAAAHGAVIACIVMVQNEVGLVQPVAAIADAIRRANPSCHIHVDAAQAFGKVPIDVRTLGADSIALAGHKFHGPKGVGALWLRNGIVVEPLWSGGGHQRGLRGGTQDTPGVAGFGLAASRAVAELPAARARWMELAHLVAEKLAGSPIRQLVPDTRRSPHILALAVPGVAASAMRSVMASRGVYLSTGSSCAEGDAKPSIVLAALGLPKTAGMVRFSFGHETTPAEVATATDLLASVARELAA